MNPAALAQFIKARRDVPFQWGTADCVVFALEAHDAANGTDTAAIARGKYKSEKKAMAMLKDAGGFLSALDGMGFKRVRRHFAQRGDVCIVNTERGPALAVCVGGAVAAQGPLGVAYLPMNAVVAVCRR